MTLTARAGLSVTIAYEFSVIGNAVHRFDLLVVGFMGHSTIFGHEWGSTSQNLMRLAPCAVLVAK